MGYCQLAEACRIRSSHAGTSLKVDENPARIVLFQLMRSLIIIIVHFTLYVYTVWPEILAGRYFGGLLKICHLAEFTLAVEPVLAIMIFIAKWLIERSGILTLP